MWISMVGSCSCVVQSYKSKMVASNKYTTPKNEDVFFVMEIPTKTEISPNPADVREIDLSQMDIQDVKSLHESDPFMYYSIPGVLKASLTLNDVDYSDITSLSHADSQPAEDGSSKALRKTRVSFESHASVVMEDMLADFDIEFGREKRPDVEDVISLFETKSRPSRQ